MDTLITVGAIAVGMGLWLWVLRGYDRIEPEALRHLLQVAVVGGLISVSVAAILNETARMFLHVRASLFSDAVSVETWRLMLFTLLVGVNEEVCKAVTAVYTTRKLGNLDEPVDAMIYAMTVGLGFASFENILYATRFGNDVLLVRFLWPVPAHMAYAALWGYGLARARFLQPDRNRAIVMAPAVLLAALVHAVANFLLFIQETATAVISLAALGVLAYMAHLRLKELVAESPFLEPGECPVCRNLNNPQATVCVHCGEPLQNTEIFVNCPCGRARVRVHSPQCHVCGRELEWSDLASSSRESAA